MPRITPPGVAIMACVLLLSSCAKPEHKFLGSWTDGHGNFLDFGQNGTLVIDKSRAATWSLINNHRITFQMKVLLDELAGTACLEDGILKIHIASYSANYIRESASGRIDQDALIRAIHTSHDCHGD